MKQPPIDPSTNAQKGGKTKQTLHTPPNRQRKPIKGIQREGPRSCIKGGEMGARRRGRRPASIAGAHCIHAVAVSTDFPRLCSGFTSRPLIEMHGKCRIARYSII